MPLGDKQKVIQEEPASWLATFGDLATLLFTFYCLIYASCTYQPGQWETLQTALERVLSVLPGETSSDMVGAPGDGTLPGGTAIVPIISTGVGLSTAARRAVKMHAQSLEDMAASQGNAEHVEVEQTATGFVFRMSTPVGFESGSSTLTPESLPMLQVLAKMIRVGHAEVIVEGHTDSVPIRNERYLSNWDLSGARAAEVVRYLRDLDIGGAYTYAKACGEYYPRVPNVDAESRARNRRVEIRVSYQQPVPTSTFVEPIPGVEPAGGG